MECITISSDDDEIQVLTVKLVQTPVKIKSNNSPSSSVEDEEEGSKSSVQWIKAEKSQLDDGSTDKNKFLSNNNLVPVITLEDDGDESDFENKSSAQTKCKTALPLQKIERLRCNSDSEKALIPQKFRNGEINSHEVEQSKRKRNSSTRIEIKGVTSIEKDSENLNEQEDGNLSNKPLVKKLIELCRRVEYGAEMTVVERKIWKYYNAALPTKTQSQDLKIFLESCISKIENILNSTKDKFLISRIIKEFINELKNDPNVVDDKLRKLYFVYNKLVRRITKLEETEVESDDDGGNPYIYLDRYRKKAVEVYNKICELEGRSSDADRPTLQRFFFTGSSAPIPVQRALERYYNKTHIFPDSYDVRKLVKKVNKEENLSLSENEIQKTAQNVFMEFGERLVKRRKYDDYNILVDYLEEQCEDPADFDMELQMKLEQNKRTRKKEQDVLDNFALMDASSSGKKEDDKADNKSEEKKDVVEPEEISSICLSSSSSSLASSPVNVNTEESEDSDEEDDESIRQKNQVKAIFSDSEEEFTILEAEDKKRRTELSVLTPKRLKTDVTNLKENGPNSEDDSSKLEVMFSD